jgi:hypothetical protein
LERIRFQLIELEHASHILLLDEALDGQDGLM